MRTMNLGTRRATLALLRLYADRACLFIIGRHCGAKMPAPHGTAGKLAMLSRCSYRSLGCIDPLFSL